MTNKPRKRSDYVYELSASQLEGLLGIAAKEDRPLEELVLEAIDQYIQREINS